MDIASTLVLSNSWEADKESTNRSWCNSSQALRYCSDPPHEYPSGSHNGNSKGALAQLSSCIWRRTPRISAGKDRAQQRALSAFIWLPNVLAGWRHLGFFPGQRVGSHPPSAGPEEDLPVGCDCQSWRWLALHYLEAAFLENTYRK